MFLGVNLNVDISNETDLNNIKLDGINLCMYVDNTMPSNAPVEMAAPRFEMLVLRSSMTGAHYIQIFSPRDSSSLYCRTFLNTWTAWKEL